MPSIETHNGHVEADYLTEGCLHADCVTVRLSRIDRSLYDVEISVLDREYTFESDVAGAMRERGFTIQTHSRGNGITALAPKGFRASPKFIKIKDLA